MMRSILLVLALLGMTPLAAQTDRAALAAQLQPLVEAGNGEAGYHLGMMRLLGIGGKKDVASAFALFKSAAEAGDALAAYKLGDFYARGENGIVEADPALALQWEIVAAEAGYALAQHDVAKMLFDSGDLETALEWLTRSAAQGHSDALRALASLHNSDAIPKDGARTYAYYKLYLRRIAAPTQKQQDFLTEFAKAMAAKDRKRGDKIVADWKTEQTPITKRAQVGLRAAEALVATLAVAQAPEPPMESSPAAPK
jgi:uncharacterized protein